jgi:hypothetical protein
LPTGTVLAKATDLFGDASYLAVPLPGTCLWSNFGNLLERRGRPRSSTQTDAAVDVAMR